MSAFKRLITQIAYSLKHYPRFLYCLWRVLRMADPKVTVFGGRHVKPESKFYDIAVECGKLLAQKNYSVLTGGGPGMMEGVLCGVLEFNKPKNRAIGIGVFGVDADFISECGYDIISLADFDSRKWLLIHFSKGFIILPGGFGTLNECTDVINLIKTHKMEKVPVVMIGVEFWKPIMIWIDQSVKQGLVEKQFKDVITCTDDLAKAINIIEKHIQNKKNVS